MTIFLDNLCAGVEHEIMDVLAPNASGLARLCHIAADLRDLAETTAVGTQLHEETSENATLAELQDGLKFCQLKFGAYVKDFGRSSEERANHIINTIISGAEGMQLAGKMYQQLADLVRNCPESELTKRDVCERLLVSLGAAYNESAEILIGIVNRYGLKTNIVNINREFATDVGPKMLRMKIQYVTENGDLSIETTNKLKEISRTRLS